MSLHLRCAVRSEAIVWRTPRSTAPPSAELCMARLKPQLPCDFSQVPKIPANPPDDDVVFKTTAAEQRIPNGSTTHPPIVATGSHVNATEPRVHCASLAPSGISGKRTHRAVQHPVSLISGWKHVLRFRALEPANCNDQLVKRYRCPLSRQSTVKPFSFV